MIQNKKTNHKICHLNKKKKQKNEREEEEKENKKSDVTKLEVEINLIFAIFIIRQN